MNRASTRPLSRATLAGCICAALLAGLLVVGLWPFHSPRNRVVWLENRNGLRFQQHSVAWSSTEFTAGLPAASWSIEIWLQPASIDESATILEFDGRNGGRLQLRQYHSGIILQTAGWNGRKFEVDDVFRKDKPVFITLASGPKATSLYLNGALVRTSRRFRSSGTELVGHLIIGTSPFRDDCWAGALHGLALHDRELTAAEVLERYQWWANSGRPELLPDGGTQALYIFNESSGNTVHDRAGSHSALVIPQRFALLQPILLEPLQEAFRPTWGFWQDVLINIGGFVPFGFFISAYFFELHKPRKFFATILIGATVSLIIELLQTYLPTRSSQTIDVVTNSLGTFLGCLLFHWTPVNAFYHRSAERIVDTLDALAPCVVDRGKSSRWTYFPTKKRLG